MARCVSSCPVLCTQPSKVGDPRSGSSCWIYIVGCLYDSALQCSTEMFQTPVLENLQPWTCPKYKTDATVESSNETTILGHGILGQVNKKNFRYPLQHLGIGKRVFMSTYFTLKLATPIMSLVTLKKKVQGGRLCNKILFLKIILQASHYRLACFFHTSFWERQIFYLWNWFNRNPSLLFLRRVDGFVFVFKLLVVLKDTELKSRVQSTVGSLTSLAGGFRERMEAWPQGYEWELDARWKSLLFPRLGYEE